jgi:acetyltransferase
MHTVFRLNNGPEITIRPIRPDDAGIEGDFVRDLSPESRRNRFLAAVRELTPRAIERFTRPEYPHEQALIATLQEGGAEKEIGVARFAAEKGKTNAEFAIVIADAWQGKGLGTRMMRELFDAATQAGMRHMEGVVLQDNRSMLQMVRDLGFRVEAYPPDPELFYVHIDLPLPHAPMNRIGDS